MVNRVEGLDGFHFHNDSMFYDQIDAVSDFEFMAFIDYGHRYFRYDLETAASQFVRQAGLVGTFQKTRAEGRMNRHRGIDYRTCYFVDT